MRRLLLVGLVALGLAASLGGGPPPPDARPSPDVEELIRQLGDKSFRRREEAARQLRERDDAGPALRRAVQESRDPEVVRHAQQILADRAARDSERALARLNELANNGEIEQAVELLVRRPHWDDEAAAWQAMTGLAERLIRLGRKEFGAKLERPQRDGYFPAGDFRRFVENARPVISVTRRVYNLDGQPSACVAGVEEIGG
jgi:hypothetical protein